MLYLGIRDRIVQFNSAHVFPTIFFPIFSILVSLLLSLYFTDQASLQSKRSVMRHQPPRPLEPKPELPLHHDTPKSYKLENGI